MLTVVGLAAVLAASAAPPGADHVPARAVGRLEGYTDGLPMWQDAPGRYYYTLAFVLDDAGPFRLTGDDHRGVLHQAGAVMQPDRAVIRGVGLPRPRDTAARQNLQHLEPPLPHRRRLIRLAAGKHCRLARAGHPPPALITPDGTARLVDLPSGAPLGIGGITYTTTEIPVAPGTGLVLYTDGLVEAREYDLDERLEELTFLLAGTHPSLDELADTLIDRLAPTPAQDDIALLIARVGTSIPR
ncbi:PP2C family protein-serine/threonine phosphatase [Streptomyces sp. NPDC052301]|uniref:PP2C family protein-serine/threonine phosphatase n=1 Tax=Streptomyces sp. NPDC052301 TaxID=3365687 RepID=UPI0037D820D0